MYDYLWKRFITVSTLLILPSISDGFKKIVYRNRNLEFAFLHLLWSHGFRNAYVGITSGMEVVCPVDYRSIWLSFKRSEAMQDISSLLGHYHSLNEWIIDSKYFDDIYFSNDKYIVYQLSLPEIWLDDYLIIGESRYSETSPEYKEHIRIKQRAVAKTSGISAFVVSRNLPYLVSMKDTGIKEELEDFLGVNLGDNEFLPKFRKDKESLDMNILTS